MSIFLRQRLLAVVLLCLPWASPVHGTSTFLTRGAVQEYAFSQGPHNCPNGSEGYCQQILTVQGKFIIVGQPPHPVCPVSKFRYTAPGGSEVTQFAPPLLPLLESVDPDVLEVAGGGGSGTGGSVAEDDYSRAIASAYKNKHLLEVTYYEATTEGCDNGVGYFELENVVELGVDARTADVNGNGLRDDVEAYLNFKYAGNPSLRSIAEQEARAIIAMNPTQAAGYLPCHAQITGREQAELEFDDLAGIIVYTKNLMIGWLSALSQMQGPGSSTCAP